MKAFAVWLLSVAVAPISLAAAFVPNSRFANPGPLLTKRVTPFFSTTEDVTSVTEGVASLLSGSEDDPVSDSELKLVRNVLQKLRGTGAQKEIHDSVVTESDADADDSVGTETIVGELDAPGKVVTSDDLANVAPALEDKEDDKNTIVELLYTVVDKLIQSRIGDIEAKKGKKMAYATYARHKEVSKTSSSR
jgi:hypothetical protein